MFEKYREIDFDCLIDFTCRKKIHLAPSSLKLEKHDIFVGVVAPGFVETERVAHRLTGPEGEAIRNQSPLGRAARPEEVAQAVLFLAAQGSEFMTGTIIDVNGASYLRQ